MLLHNIILYYIINKKDTDLRTSQTLRFHIIRSNAAKIHTLVGQNILVGVC